MSDEEIVQIVSSEIVLAVDADRIITASELEATTFIEFGFRPPVILGYGVDAAPSPQQFDTRRDFPSVGPLLGPETPNVDGLTWFIDSVMPPMKRLSPTQKAALHAVGTCQVLELEQRQNSSFRLLGHLTDITQLYGRYRVFVAPTRFCAGISLKVIEAAAFGLPIVTTPVVASQLGWRDEQEVLVGLNEYDFAAKCAALYSNEELWLRLRSNALKRVSEQFSPDVFRKRAQGLLLEYWSRSSP
jgi:glycosyltransferase involved in cell wall biosynthesis